MWGRGVYDNIRKFLQFQLTVNGKHTCYTPFLYLHQPLRCPYRDGLRGEMNFMD